MFIKIRFMYTMTYVFKVHVKIVEIYMVKFNALILNKLNCCKIVSPILLQKLINDFALCKHYTVLEEYGTLHVKIGSFQLFESHTNYTKTKSLF